MNANQIFFLALAARAMSPWPAAAFDAPKPSSPSQELTRNYSLPIRITRLPPGSEFVPVSCAIDFGELAAKSQVPAVVDERTLRLFRRLPGGKEEEIPFQFVSDSMPRPAQRRLLEGTSGSVSYLAEYEAGELPAGLKTSGRLTWMVSLEEAHEPGEEGLGGTGSFLLRFGARPAGRFIQVPYPPYHLRGFDNETRATPVRWFPRMEVRPKWPYHGVLHVYEENQLVTSYHLGPMLDSPSENPVIRRPFFYPVHGPGGFPLTEFGKPHDPPGSHAHHYSLWVAHADVDGHDFWSERGGIIAHEAIERVEEGPVYARIRHRLRWMRHSESLLRETRQWTFYRASEDFRLLDLEMRFEPADNRAVTLGRTTFGFLAARVRESMNVFDGGGEILNGQGGRNETGAHLQPAAWLDQSGPIAQDRWGGVALLDHPGNSNHPTVWHCRNDGWAGASFNARQSLVLSPGRPLELRYRVVLHKGGARAARLDRRFAELAMEPQATLGEVQKEL